MADILQIALSNTFNKVLLALGQAYDYPSISDSTLKNMGKINT